MATPELGDPLSRRATDRQKATAAAGLLAAALLTSELVVAQLALQPNLRLGLYPIVLAAAGLVVGSSAHLASRFAVAIGSRWLRLPAFLNSAWTTVALLAAGLALLHAHQFRVPNAVTIVGTWVFRAGLPLAVVLVVALRWQRRRSSIAPSLLAPAAVAVAALLVTSVALDRTIAARTAEYRGPWAPGNQATTSIAAAGNASDAPRLLMIGLDGADWAYINPLLNEGRLPNLARLLSSGVHGILQNSDVAGYVSPVAWTNIVTGTLPDQHGVSTWASAPTRLPRVWDMLAALADDRRSLVLNLPGTFPVAEGTGVRTAGMAAPGIVPGTEQGWLATADARITTSRGPLTASIGRDAACPGGTRFIAPSDRFNLNQSPFRNTSPGIFLTALATDVRKGVARALSRTVEPALTFCAQYDAATGELVLTADDAEARVVVPGSWSPWLVFATPEGPAVTRLKTIASAGTDPSLFLGPVTVLEIDGLVAPANALATLSTSQPWLSPAADSIDLLEYQEDSNLVTLSVEWDLAVEAARIETGMALLARGGWDDVAYILGSTDRLHHVLINEIVRGGYVGDSAGVLPELAAAYVAADRWLGQFLAYAGENTLVAVLSDHGSRPGMGYRLHHGPDGIYVFAGPNLPADLAGPAIQQVDVVQIILAHLGYPSADDLPGGVPDQLWPRSESGDLLALPDPISSYADLYDAGSGGRDDATVDPRVLEQLRALGYVR